MTFVLDNVVEDSKEKRIGADLNIWAENTALNRTDTTRNKIGIKKTKSQLVYNWLGPWNSV